ncbi:cobalamin biosynthesis protein [Novosphingobium mathurense]|uniref:Cobalt-precorrin 5A hydrolase n=1 Tax=Novosphingobium mathurense TaxID=428990 RepID=A0A1U6GTX3_9SPHN|nr:cobalamin biosynthesis protein [Novosphingobium mathurense]SLJ86992.1 cobalt-precorrin 5A hydrolase [Novosphingobium mathurense]
MIVAGFGFRQGATLQSIEDALALAQQFSPRVTLLATAADKAVSPEMARLAAVLGLPLTGVSGQVLARIATPTRSEASLASHGTGSVAEASALAAAGPGAQLIAMRHISPDRMATCAIAQGLTP